MQRNPEFGGVAPPKNNHVPNLRYVYDAIQDGRVTATMKWTDISTFSVFDVRTCPYPWGGFVVSATGGAMVGYDYLGQRTGETLAAGVFSDKTYSWIESAPADTLWDTSGGIGVPYRVGATPGLTMIQGPSDAVLGGPGLHSLGILAFVTMPSDGDWLEFSYNVDTTNLHGDAYTDIASASIDSNNTSMVGTVDSTGAVAITTVAVADAGTNLHFHFPDGGYVKAANGAGTVNYTLSPLWMQQYANRSSDIDEDVLIKWCGDDANIGGHVDLTGDVEPASLPAAYTDYGPFAISEGGTFTVHKHRSDPAQHEVGFNIDTDPDHEVRVPLHLLPAMTQLSQQSYDTIRAKVQELLGTDIGDKQ